MDRSIIVVIFFSVVDGFWPILPDRNLDTLGRETLAERRTLNDTGEFLGRKYLEGFREGASQYRSTASRKLIALANIDEVHLEAAVTLAEIHSSQTEIRASAPKCTLRTYGEILQDEPHADLVVGVCKLERTHAESADKITGV